MANIKNNVDFLKKHYDEELDMLIGEAKGLGYENITVDNWKITVAFVDVEGDSVQFQDLAHTHGLWRIFPVISLELHRSLSELIPNITRLVQLRALLTELHEIKNKE